MSDINLLPKNQGILVSKEHGIRVVRFIAFGILSFVVFFSLILFIIRIQSPLTSLKKQEASLLSTLTLSNTKMAKHLIIVDRLTTISTVLGKRPQLDTIVSAFLSKLPPNVTLISLQITLTKVQITGTSDSLLDINTFLNNLVLMVTKKEIIGRLVLQGLSFDAKKGTYNFILEATLL
ncbi:MAG: hypothetical protein HYT10_02135 [Candidatus Levybacteria bacterium]|nr:hypothetical protein [Candidatus Levybacteria bacterium]